jgi:sortase A
MRRLQRIVAVVLMLGALVTGAWTLTVWLWQDPFTALYTSYEQGRLATSLDHELATYRAPRPAAGSSLRAEEEAVAQAAWRFQHGARRGQAIGRIRVPRMGLNMVLVNGTDESTLEKGPGRYLGSGMPGEGRLVYIAGHRTTYLAPFSKIDLMRKGDRITVQLPYATFVYHVTGYRIVPANDLAVLRSPGHELLELQACHPRFSASHRYIVYALPLRVVPRHGRPYVPVGKQE